MKIQKKLIAKEIKIISSVLNLQSTLNIPDNCSGLLKYHNVNMTKAIITDITYKLKGSIFHKNNY